jgi:hypothetical protein
VTAGPRRLNDISASRALVEAKLESFQGMGELVIEVDGEDHVGDLSNLRTGSQLPAQWSPAISGCFAILSFEHKKTPQKDQQIVVGANAVLKRC